jgi:hypothetical protein
MMDMGRSPKGKKSTRDAIEVTLMHEGHATVWELSINTSTRVLYCLAHRATKARYSRFTLRLTNSKATIRDSANLTLGLTELSHGGVIELSSTFPHKRRLAEVTIQQRFGSGKQVVLLPQDAPILALIGHLERKKFGSMSSLQLWCILYYASCSFFH